MSALATAAALLAAAVLLVPLFKKLGLGSVMGYLVAGVLIGPSAFGVIHEPEAVLQTAEFGVTLLMFIIGLELQTERLWALRKSVFGLGSLHMLACTIVLGALAWSFNILGVAAIIVGVALTMTSTAFALPGGVLGAAVSGLKRHPNHRVGWSCRSHCGCWRETRMACADRGGRRGGLGATRFVSHVQVRL